MQPLLVFSLGNQRGMPLASATSFAPASDCRCASTARCAYLLPPACSRTVGKLPVEEGAVAIKRGAAKVMLEQEQAEGLCQPPSSSSSCVASRPCSRWRTDRRNRAWQSRYAVRWARRLPVGWRRPGLVSDHRLGGAGVHHHVEELSRFGETLASGHRPCPEPALPRSSPVAR